MDTKLGFIVFHMFIPEDSEKIIESYFKVIKNQGVYDEVDHILLYIKYVDDNTLTKVKDIISNYSKIQILRCEHRLDPLNEIVTPYIALPPLEENPERPLWSTIGEGETLLHLFDDPLLNEYKEKYEFGLFLHSKSISHYTKWNLRVGLTPPEGYWNHSGVYYGVKSIKWCRKLCTLEDRSVDLDCAQSFIFKCKDIQQFSIYDFLKGVWEIDATKNQKYRFVRLQGGKLPHYNKHIEQMGILKFEGEFKFKIINRLGHTFFVDKLNFLLDKKDFIPIE